MKRRRRFRVLGRFDGAHIATVEIFAAGEELLFAVRPYRRRKTFTLPLAAVARGVVFEVVMAEMAERRRAKKARR